MPVKWRSGTAVRVALVLDGCGGGVRVSGEIGTACIGGGRDAANPALCSCVQRAADQALTAAEQRRAATFFANPHLAQEVRQSDRASDERFWQRYRAFSERAEAMCG
ncbi:MAG: arginine transporter [Rubellimicrobium sp.]|nr:arginine transporter [Rubellimicrobium sp.]